ncbi:U3 snoRNP protein [Entophlyctis sp. JEL0112]|nr:U3 snoRNP protein [Entophlyctis sp. JEL0112]
MSLAKRKTTPKLAEPNPDTSAAPSKRRKAAAAAKALAALQAEVNEARARIRAESARNKDAEELELEDLVFGAAVASSSAAADGERTFSGVLDRASAAAVDVAHDDDDAEEVAGDEDAELFVVDRNRATFVGNVGDDEDDGSDGNAEISVVQAANGDGQASVVPLWEDHHDSGFKVDISNGPSRLRKLRDTEEETELAASEYETRLRKQFLKLHPTPAWAKNPDRSLMEESWSHSSISTVLRSTRSMIDRSMRMKLLSDELSMLRLKDANQASPSASVVQSCQFHPNAPVLLTAGWDRTLRLFHVDGKFNPKLQSVFFKDMPIHSAGFSADGRQVVVTGRRKFFYVYDVEAGQAERIAAIRGREEKSFERCTASPCGKYLAFLGRNGYIILVSGRSKQWIANLRMNGTVRAIDFSKDGRWLFSVGADGEVYQWDLATRQCVHKFTDEGAVKVNVISVSPDNSLIATGSSAGIVNVYSAATALTSSNPSPARSMMNLTTSISHLAFHPSSQALVFGSRTKKDSLRVAHCPSLKVYSNWPTMHTPLGYVNCVEWSPGGGYLAIGNDKGKVLLYRATAFEAC